jgi:antitoxin HigA-1
VHCQRDITPGTALRLDRLLGVEAQFWLNLQFAWDLYVAQHSAAAKEIVKIQRLKRPTRLGAGVVSLRA